MVPLPPPVRPNITEEIAITYNLGGNYNNNNNDPNFGRIMHTFVDPTGCHVLLSARNGEAYYVHSTSKSVQKLSGFGPSADGSYSDFTPGLTLNETSTSSSAAAGGDDKVLQTGLTPGLDVLVIGVRKVAPNVSSLARRLGSYTNMHCSVPMLRLPQEVGKPNHHRLLPRLMPRLVKL